jgi:hypothetical protein
MSDGHALSCGFCSSFAVVGQGSLTTLLVPLLLLLLLLLLLPLQLHPTPECSLWLCKVHILALAWLVWMFVYLGIQTAPQVRREIESQTMRKLAVKMTAQRTTAARGSAHRQQPGPGQPLACTPLHFCRQHGRRPDLRLPPRRPAWPPPGMAAAAAGVFSASGIAM